MRARILARSALVLALGLVACKGDDADTTTTGPDAHCSAGYGDGPEIDPDYPPCGCDAGACDNGGACRFSGFTPAWTSSLCHPTCTCTDPNDKDGLCGDNSCPMLGDIAPTCADGLCVVFCNEHPCPNGYTCGGNNTCEVQLE